MTVFKKHTLKSLTSLIALFRISSPKKYFNYFLFPLSYVASASVSEIHRQWD